MKDNLVEVVLCMNRKQKRRSRRLMSGRLQEGELVTLAKDEMPLQPKQFCVTGFLKDGTPLVEPFVKAKKLPQAIRNSA